jgi:hypothetical protein
MILIILVGLAIATVTFYLIISKVRESADPILNNPTSSAILSESESTVGYMDYTYIIAYIGLGMFLIISMVFIRSHPVFLFVSIVLLVVLILVSAIMSNAFDSLTAEGEMNVSASNFPIITYTVGKMPLFMLILAFLGLIVLLAKPWERNYV